MKKYLRYVPAFLWMLVIFYFSSQSTSGIEPAFTSRFVFFKTLHLLEYCILGFLFRFAQMTPKQTVLFGYSYAVSDEIHQMFSPHRTPKFTDTLFDLVGISLGLILFNLLFRLYQSILK